MASHAATSGHDTVKGLPWEISGRDIILLLGGLFLYAVYSYVIYALGLHFNRLFLVYCAAIGLSAAGLLRVTVELVRERAWTRYADDAPVRLAGGTSIAIAAVFAALWLRDIVPAVIHGGAPASLVAVGLATNPVQALDLALALPALFTAGLAMVRRRPAGLLAVPALLTFSAVMAVAMIVMSAATWARGVADGLASLVFASVLLTGSAVVVARLMRSIERSARGPSAGI